ncbi:DUF6053 domain-containing protein [Lysobacter enzymogenes]|uniref:DUF6053 domain-containing protein n=1 Tax=Lysobacter enzymogenes TaxID=69 RepID=UPI003CCDBF56
MPAQPLVGGPSGPRLLCQSAATGNKSVGPEGPPTRDPSLGAGGPTQRDPSLRSKDLPGGSRPQARKLSRHGPSLGPEGFPTATAGTLRIRTRAVPALPCIVLLPPIRAKTLQKREPGHPCGAFTTDS